jgi:hypothetical protein
MDNVRTIFMIVVAAAVLILFGVGVWGAGYYTLWAPGAPVPDAMPNIAAYFVSAVNGTLAANLGAILGISISLRGWSSPRDLTETLQWVAAGWYVAMLLFAMALWWKAGFTEDPSRVVSILPEMTKNGVGIFIAILAAVLGVQTAVTRSRAVGHDRSE